MKRRTFVVGLLPLAASAQSLPADYPSKPIRLIIPYAPGGPADVVARGLAELVGNGLPKPILVDNKPGAGGSLGTKETLSAPADGHTFGIVIADSLVSAPFLLSSAKYDVRTDATLLYQICDTATVLMATPGSGITSFAQLLSEAKKRRGAISYASYGPGSSPHLSMHAVETQSGVSLTGVPYKGFSQAMNDFLGQHVDLLYAPAALVQKQIGTRAGTPLATVSPARSSNFLSVPTFSELGFDSPVLRTRLWIGIFGPKSLPAPLLDWWVAKLETALRSPQFVQTIATAGFTPTGIGPRQFASLVGSEIEATGALIRSMGLKPE